MGRMLQAAALRPAQRAHGIHIYIPQDSHNYIQSFLSSLVWKNLMADPGYLVKGWFGSVLEVSAFLVSLQNLSMLWALEVVCGVVVALVGHEVAVVVGVEMVMSYFFPRIVIEMVCDTHVDSADLQQDRHSTLLET